MFFSTTPCRETIMVHFLSSMELRSQNNRKLFIDCNQCELSWGWSPTEQKALWGYDKNIMLFMTTNTVILIYIQIRNIAIWGSSWFSVECGQSHWKVCQCLGGIHMFESTLCSLVGASGIFIPSSMYFQFNFCFLIGLSQGWVYEFTNLQMLGWGEGMLKLIP